MDAVICESTAIREWWRKERLMLPPVAPPEGITQGVPGDVYNAYRRGRDSACVDIMLCTRSPLGSAAVLLSKRASNVCFANKWWMYGGALGSYEPIEEFLAGRVEKECGIRAKPEVLIGVYRTCAADFIGSTLQPCYAARIPYGKATAKATTDSAHSSVRLFTRSELETIPIDEQHWYPMRVARLVLDNLP